MREKLRRVASIANLNTIITWLPVSRENGIWVDSFTGERISEPKWNPGIESVLNDSSRPCAIFSYEREGYINWPCLYTGGIGGWYCSCQFPGHFYLTLRGLCKDSHLDQMYQPENSPVDGETTYFGNRKTAARYLREENQWKMETYVFNTTALSEEISKRFMLRKQMWTIEGDSQKCHEGKPYTAELKLTGCKDGQFTCKDGQCIKMEERCNQVPDCRDESDERECKVIILKDSYNKIIPPIRRGNAGIYPANVSISISLMKIVEIEETDHSILLQFQISLQWKENRAKFQNLKKESSLNALTEEDIKTIWLPLIVYDNTDQMEVTRLGMDWEWGTSVTVTREGNFTRSSIEEVDETEIFEGAENRLTMNQTYTWEFQCEYVLQRYPFDKQVTDSL